MIEDLREVCLKSVLDRLDQVNRCVSIRAAPDSFMLFYYVLMHIMILFEASISLQLQLKIRFQYYEYYSV